jgi:hypothetical protein
MSSNNALVPIAPPQQKPATPADRRAHSDFIAHLIATAARAPQTRARRRAEPQVALAAYRAIGQWPSETGRVLSRSI